MLDLHKIEGFEWDQGNAQKSERKHGVTSAETEQIFSNFPLRLAEDVAHSESEPRYHALGMTNAGRLLHVTFTLRGRLLRVISARLANRKERKQYEEEKTEADPAFRR
jgi:uncharacterized DUF497 family protein